jgi:hypothetical protein
MCETPIKHKQIITQAYTSTSGNNGNETALDTTQMNFMIGTMVKHEYHTSET